MAFEEYKDKLTTDGISTLTDEELQAYLSTAVNGLVDSNGKNLVFYSEDEATIYAAQLQRNFPNIRFFKIIPSYSNVVGKFYMIEPNVTEYSQKNFKNDSDFETGEDFVIVNEVILMAIIENAKREKAKYDAEKAELKTKLLN